jgi:hypothetical protein
MYLIAGNPVLSTITYRTSEHISSHRRHPLQKPSLQIRLEYLLSPRERAAADIRAIKSQNIEELKVRKSPMDGYLPKGKKQANKQTTEQTATTLDELRATSIITTTTNI